MQPPRNCLIIAVLLAASSCAVSEPEMVTTNAGPQPPLQEITFLALGDSYTIGESVPDYLNWPN